MFRCYLCLLYECQPQNKGRGGGGGVLPGSHALDDIAGIATWESKRAVSHWFLSLFGPQFTHL